MDGKGQALAHHNDKQENSITLPDQQHFKMTVVGVTPEIASAWLSRNRGNRAITASVVKDYQNDMERGEWRDAGDPIRFGKTGRLLDGQQRLMALLAANVKIKFVVIVGLDDNVMPYIDTGKKRTAANVLSLEGLSDWQSKCAATAAQFLIGKQQSRPLYSSVKSSNHVVRGFVLDNPKFVSTVHFIEKLPRVNPPITHSFAAVLHWEFRKKDSDLADRFMEGLFSGAGLNRDSPILTLRNRLKDDRTAPLFGRTPSSGHSIRARMHGCIKAWNFVRAGKRCTSARTLMPRSDDAFPEIE